MEYKLTVKVEQIGEEGKSWGYGTILQDESEGYKVQNTKNVRTLWRFFNTTFAHVPELSRLFEGKNYKEIIDNLDNLVDCKGTK